LSSEAGKESATLNATINGRSNNSFDRSGISVLLIENLSHDMGISRPVNSGVRLLLNMTNPPPDIIAEVHFLPTESGGRKGPTPSNRFGCPLLFESELFDCVMFLDNIDSISPGSTVTLPIWFLSPDLIKPRLSVGSDFGLWEIGVIANGKVVEILNDASNSRCMCCDGRNLTTHSTRARDSMAFVINFSV
jgi:hypothetical protein